MKGFDIRHVFLSFSVLAIGLSLTAKLCAQQDGSPTRPGSLGGAGSAAVKETGDPPPPDRQPGAEEKTLPQGQSGEAPNTPKRSRRSSFGRRLLEKFERIRPPDIHERRHKSVTGAFREVIESCGPITVQVLCDGNKQALGAIVDAEGFVLTKASELKGKIECVLRDGRRVAARITGIYEVCDLAMLKIEAENLQPVKWAQAEPPVGSWLATTGLGELPAAIGVASAASRRINPRRAILGIVLDESAKGPVVRDVMRGSGAEKAGLRNNDVVLQVNGSRTPRREDIVNLIRQFRPGRTLQLKILRNDQEMEVDAVLSALDDLVTGNRVQFQNQLGGPLSNRRADFPLALQHDTMLRPSDCGGPVVNLDGEVVGINIARAGRVASYALPTKTILPLLDDLKSGKYAPASPQTQKQLELARRRERLEKNVHSWAEELSRLRSSLEQSRARLEMVQKEAAGEADASGQTKTVLEQARKAFEQLQEAAKRVEAELQKAQMQLKEVEQQQVALSGESG